MPKQSLLTGALSLMIAQGVVLVLGYITHPLVGRLLGPGPYGVYGIIISIQTIVGLILTMGIPVAISRFVARDNEHAKSILKNALKLQLYIALGLAFATLLVSPWIAQLLNDASLTNYIRFVAFIILCQAGYPIYVQYLNGLQRFNKQAALTILYAIAKLLGAVVLLTVWHVYGALAGFAIGGLIAALIGWYWTRGLGGKAQKQLPLQSFLSFAGTYVLILVGLQILMSLDLFMVKSILKNDTEAGHYNAAVTLSRISYFMLQALAFILLPSVSALTRPGKSHDEAVTFIRDALRYLIALTVPAITLAAATSKPLIGLFFAHEFLPAAPALTILMIGVGSISFYLLLTNIVAGAGRARSALYLTITLIFMSFVLGSILIPRYGLIGAAWQTTLTGLTGLVILAAYTFRVFKIQFPIRSTINICIATIVAVLPTYLWSPSPLLLPLCYLVLLAVYVVVLVLLGEVSPSDRQRLAKILPRISWIG